MLLGPFLRPGGPGVKKRKKIDPTYKTKSKSTAAPTPTRNERKKDENSILRQVSFCLNVSSSEDRSMYEDRVVLDVLDSSPDFKASVFNNEKIDALLSSRLCLPAEVIKKNAGKKCRLETECSITQFLCESYLRAESKSVEDLKSLLVS